MKCVHGRGNCARLWWCEGEVKCDGRSGGKWVRGGIKEWMKLKVVRGAKREGNMDLEREEGQKRCIISGAPPSPFALSGGGRLTTPPLPSFVKLFPQRRGGELEWAQRKRGSDWEERQRVLLSRDSHVSAAADTSGDRTTLAGDRWAVASVTPGRHHAVRLSEPANSPGWTCAHLDLPVLHVLGEAVFFLLSSQGALRGHLRTWAVHLHLHHAREWKRRLDAMPGWQNAFL